MDEIQTNAPRVEKVTDSTPCVSSPQSTKVIDNLISQHWALERKIEELSRQKDVLAWELRSGYSSNFEGSMPPQGEVTIIGNARTFEWRKFNRTYARNIITEIGKIERRNQDLKRQAQEIELELLEIEPLNVREALMKIIFLCNSMLYCDHIEFELFICEINEMAKFASNCLTD